VSGALVRAVAAATALVRWYRFRGDADRRRLLRLAVALPISIVAAAATPLGFKIFPFAVESVSRGYAIGIEEWFPTYPNSLGGVGFWLLALGFVGALVARGRALLSKEAAWGDGALVAAALVLLPLAARSQRNIAVFLMVAAVAASGMLGADFRFGRRRKVRPAPAAATPERGRLNLALLGLVSTAAVVAVALVWRGEAALLGWHPIGDDALAAVRGCPGPLYNRYDEGGFLIWFAPEKPVFVDSRQDPYPLPFLLEHLAVERGAPYRPLFARYRIGCAFLPAPGGGPRSLADRLRADGWHPRFVDERWTILTAPEHG